MMYYSKDTAFDLKIIVIISDNDLWLQFRQIDSWILEHFLILPLKNELQDEEMYI